MVRCHDLRQSLGESLISVRDSLLEHVIHIRIAFVSYDLLHVSFPSRPAFHGTLNSLTMLDPFAQSVIELDRGLPS